MNLVKPRRIVGNDAARFRSKYVLDPATGCHVWVARTVTRDGYGRLKIAGRLVLAHVYAYEQKHGPVPDGLILDHYVCDRHECVNGDHVRPASRRENTLRGTTLAAANTAKVKCPREHAYSPENTRHSKTGKRYCLTCKRERSRADREAARVAAARSVSSKALPSLV